MYKETCSRCLAIFYTPTGFRNHTCSSVPTMSTEPNQRDRELAEQIGRECFKRKYDQFIFDNERALPIIASYRAELIGAAELSWRREIWLSHCHSERLYGDDGEMQCGLTDFKRDPIEKLMEHIRLTQSELIGGVYLAAAAILNQIERRLSESVPLDMAAIYNLRTFQKLIVGLTPGDSERAMVLRVAEATLMEIMAMHVSNGNDHCCDDGPCFISKREQSARSAVLALGGKL